jgi:hypothetical protein
MTRAPGNPRRMDLAALDFTGVQAVTPATRKATLSERVGHWFSRPVPVEELREPGLEVYVWHDVSELIDRTRP